MSLTQLRNVNFGRTLANATGSTGVGYAVLDSAGSVVAPRTVTGVYQLTSGSGLYAAAVSFPDDFHGQIMWDTGTAFPTASYAVEEYNVEQNDPKVSSLYDIGFGRWRIINNQMIFFKADNITEVARFNLFDENGVPVMDSVFERQKV